MLFRELNRGKCKTYLIACEETKRAALVDPVKERLERYLSILAYEGLRLDVVIDTHTHADHRTASFDLRDLVGACAIMHRWAPAPHIDRHVDARRDRPSSAARKGTPPISDALRARSRRETERTLCRGSVSPVTLAGAIRRARTTEMHPKALRPARDAAVSPSSTGGRCAGAAPSDA